MRSVLAVSAFAVLAAAQDSDVPKYESSLNMTIDNPGAIDPQKRAEWCANQNTVCTQLCDSVETINCISETLKWECTCSSNHSQPALQYYVNSMPTHICQYVYQQCIANHGSSAAQKDCIHNIQDLCGTVDAADAMASTTTTTTVGATTTGKKGSKATGKESSATTATDDSATSTSTGLAAPTLMPGAQGVGAAALAAIGALAYLV